MTTTLLAVENSQTMRKVLEITFAAVNVNLTLVSSGTEAMNAISTLPVNIALVDVTLEDVNGYDLCQQLKAQSPNTSVLILSSKQQPYDAARGGQVGADDFMDKPFDSPCRRASETLSPGSASSSATRSVTPTSNAYSARARSSGSGSSSTSDSTAYCCEHRAHRLSRWRLDRGRGQRSARRQAPGPRAQPSTNGRRARPVARSSRASRLGSRPRVGRNDDQGRDRTRHGGLTFSRDLLTDTLSRQTVTVVCGQVRAFRAQLRASVRAGAGGRHGDRQGSPRADRSDLTVRRPD